MQPSLKKNYIYRVFYEVLILITPFITTPYVSRVLGADGVGDYSFTYSIITYFMLFGALGTAGYGSREIAQARDEKKRMSKLFWEIELMTIGTTAVCMIVWIAVILAGQKYRYHFLALTPFLLSVMFDISWFFNGLERVKNIVIRNSFVRIVGIFLLFLFVKKKDDVLIYCIINSATSLLGSLSMWLYLPGMLEKVDIRSFRFKHHFHETLIYFIPTIATSIYTVLDKTLIGFITGSSYQNGYYEQATKIINIVKSVVFVAVNSIMSARISYLFAEEKYQEIKSKITKSMDFISLLGVGSIFGLVGISQRFVPVFFGPGYDSVVYLIWLMSPLIMIIGISNCLGNQYYTPSGKRALSAKFIVAGAGINLILNLCLIPMFKSYGAVVASIIAELVITILYVRYCERYLTWTEIYRMLYKRVIAGIIMAVAVFFIGTLNLFPILSLCLQVLCGASLYGLILLIFRDEMLAELIGIAFDTFNKILRIKDK